MWWYVGSPAHPTQMSGVVGAQISELLSPFKGASTVCRVAAPLVADVGKLNDRLVAVHKLLSSLKATPAADTADAAPVLRDPMWVEGSCAALIALARIPDTIMLRSNVFPAVQVFLERGSEAAALEEVRQLARVMQPIQGAQLVAILCVDR